MSRGDETTMDNLSTTTSMAVLDGAQINNIAIEVRSRGIYLLDFG
jgi:hypothetical protein